MKINIFKSVFFVFIFSISTSIYSQDSPCVTSLEKYYVGHMEQFEELRKAVDKEVTYYRNENNIRTLKSYLERVEGQISSCKEEATDYDFSDLEDRYVVLNADLEKISNFFDESVAFAKDMKKKVHVLGQLKKFIIGLPYNTIDEEHYEKITYADIELLQNYPEDESSFYRDIVKKALGYIAEMEAALKVDEHKEKVYVSIDEKYSKNDKKEGQKKIKAFTYQMNFVKVVVLPNNEDLKDLIKYGEKVGGKLDVINTNALDAIAVSQFHKDNVNKIFFTSNLNLDPKKAVAADFKTKFTVGENIKAIAYFDEKFSVLYDGRMPRYTIKSPYKQMDAVAESVSKSELKNSYLSFYIVTDANNYINNHNRGCYTCNAMAFLSDLPPRPQKMKVSISSWGDFHTDKRRDVLGEFTIDGSDDEGLAKLKREIVKISDKYLSGVKLPKPIMRNASYEKKIVTHYNSLGWDEVFKKTIIRSKAWTYKKNYKGVIIYRTLQVAMVSSNNGKCQYQDFTVKQEKIGSGYGSFEHLSVGSSVDISCSKVK